MGTNRVFLNMKKMLLYTFVGLSTLSCSVLFGMEKDIEEYQKKERENFNQYNQERIRREKSDYTHLHDGQEASNFQPNGITSLQFKAALIAKKLSQYNNDASEKLEQQKDVKGYLEFVQTYKHDYEVALLCAVESSHSVHELVQDLIIETHFPECDDEFKAEVLCAAAQGGNLKILHALMQLVDSNGPRKSLELLKPLLLKPAAYRECDPEYRKTSWNKSNRHIAEYLFELVLQEFVQLNPNKKRCDYVFKTQLTKEKTVDLSYNALMVAAHIGSLKHVKEFINTIDATATLDFGITALYEAARSGNIELIDYLTDCGLDSHAFIHCFENADPAVARALYRGLEKSCATQEEYVTKQFVGGTTLLHYAVILNLKDEVRLLLNCGARVNHTDDYSETVLFDAVRRGLTDIVKLLIDRGADVNHKNKYKQTVLFYCHDLGIAKMLVKAGCDVNAVNLEGASAIFYINNSEVAVYLLNLGAHIVYKDGRVNPICRFLSQFQNCSDDASVHALTRAILLIIEKMDCKDLEKIASPTIQEFILAINFKHASVMKKREVILEALFKKGVKPKWYPFLIKDSAFSEDDLDLCRKYGLDANAVDDEGHTILKSLEDGLVYKYESYAHHKTIIEYVKKNGGKKRTLKSTAQLFWANKYLMLGVCATSLLGLKYASRDGILGIVGLISLIESSVFWHDIWLQIRK